MHGTLNKPGEAAPGQRHGPWEDAYAVLVGSLLLALGLVLLRTAGLSTGGVAGLSLTLSYLTGMPLGIFYIALTLPALAVTMRTMRWTFAARTVLVSVLVFAMTSLSPLVAQIGPIHPAVAAIAGGNLFGMGALALARHATGTGGSGALVLWLYRTRGWNAGQTQMAIDAAVLTISLIAIDLERFGWSMVGVAATAGILYVWHRPGRYTGY